MNTKISVVILTKDEGFNLEHCINHIQKHVDEVIVIDGGDDNLAKTISNNLSCHYYKRKINEDNIKGFGDLRNFASCVAKNEWILHIDVDEMFSDFLFSNIDTIIEQQKSWAYAFPRINLPFYESYPDYQVRLVNKMKTEWVNEVHEKLDILVDPVEVIYLDNYPIIHKERPLHQKIQTNKRWLSTGDRKNILICSAFKDSEKFIDRFLNNLLNLIAYSKTKHDIELCFIEGNSTDFTALRIKNWLQSLPEDINYKYKNLHISSKTERFTALSIMRNMLIKIGLKNYHNYVLMIDSDTIFEPSLIEKLITSIEENQCDVIAPLVFIENFKEHSNDYFYDTLAYIDINGINFKHLYPYSKETKTDIIKANSVGTCYLIKADIYNINDFKDFNIIKCYNESMSKPLILYEGVEDNKPISEQISFFKKLKRKGYQIYIDKNIKILHVNLEKLGLKWH